MAESKAVPFHKNAPTALGGTNSADEFIGALKMIIGTKIPGNHQTIIEAIGESARLYNMAEHSLVLVALHHVAAESGEVMVGINDMAHAG